MARERQRHAHGGQEPKGEREAAGEQVGGRRGAEPQGAQPRVVAEVTACEGLEQRCRAHCGQAPRDLRGQQRRHGWEQDAVAGDVVAGVPPVVPQSNPSAENSLARSRCAARSRLGGEMITYAIANRDATAVGAMRLRVMGPRMPVPDRPPRGRRAMASVPHSATRRALPGRAAPRSRTRTPRAATDPARPTAPVLASGVGRAPPRQRSGPWRCPTDRGAGLPAVCPGQSRSRSAAICSSVHGPPLRSPRANSHLLVAPMTSSPISGRCHRRASPVGKGSASKQRWRIDQHESLDPLRVALGQNQRYHGAPVVPDQPYRVDLQMVEQRLHERGQTVDRVIEVSTLARAPEPDQVRCDPAAAFQERHPIGRARRHAVQIQAWSGGGRRAVEHGRAAELDRVFLDVHGRARITSAPMSTRSRRDPGGRYASARRSSTSSASDRSTT